jgi:hypothetical protein
MLDVGWREALVPVADRSTARERLRTGVLSLCAAVAGDAGCDAGPPTAAPEARDVSAPASVDPPAPAPVADPNAIATADPELAPARTLPDGARLPDAPRVRVAALVAALEAIAAALEDVPALRDEYAAWCRAHALEPTDRLWRDWVRVRLVFECVRDGGLWQLRWAITNRAPRSDAIWAQWAALDGFDPDAEAALDTATATAECDELSALFAVLVRRLGVEDVGLFWPEWNHVVAVWTITDGQAAPVRVVVPTSQIFLDDDASLGTDGFDPWRQKTIYEYRRRDVRDDAELPGPLARFFVARAWAEIERSQAELQADRNARSAKLGGS